MSPGFSQIASRSRSRAPFSGRLGGILDRVQLRSIFARRAVGLFEPHLGLLAGRELPGLLPHLAAEHRARELPRLERDRRPEEHLGRAPAFLARDRLAPRARFLAVPDLPEALLPQVAER